MHATRQLAQAFFDTHPGDAARLLEPLPRDRVAAALAYVPPATAAGVLSRMPAAVAASCVAGLGPEQIAGVVTALRPDAASRLLRPLDPAQRTPVLDALPRDVAEPLDSLLRYPDGTAGAWMDPQAVAVSADLLVGDALREARRAASHVRYYVYVVDRTQALVGVVTLRELLLTPRRTRLDAIMRRDVARLSATATPTAIVAHPGWRAFHALPVVDTVGRFLGVVRYETLRALEANAGGTPPPVDPLAAVLTVGELCWVGMTRTIGELVEARLSKGRASAEDAHGN